MARHAVWRACTASGIIAVCILINCCLASAGDCSCVREYDPVCGLDNVTYSSPCFAECSLGANHWSKGRCEQDELNPVAGCIGNARCLRDACQDPWPSQCQNPLPRGAVCFSNPCTGITLPGSGRPLDACAAIWVDPATKQIVQCGGPTAAQNPPSSCSCTKEYEPVCGSDGTTYGNKCTAACALGPDGNWTAGPCAKGCVCPMVWAPVCGSDNVTYSNACEAGCALKESGGSWTDGECGGGKGCDGGCICTKEYDPVCGSDGITYGNKCEAACELGQDGNWTAGPCSKGCVCPDIYMPVCGSDNVTYSNECEARCVLGEGAEYTAGECPGDSPSAPEADPCICYMLYLPVCGSDGKTYGNNCEAKCALGKTGGSWTPGACGTVSSGGGGGSSDGGNGTACFCTEQYDPVCGSDGKDYGNACEAACVLGADGRWANGTCASLDPFAGCAGNVRCKRNSCADGPCPRAAPGSMCFMTTCSGQSLGGRPVEACAAVWVDPLTREAVVCGGEPEGPAEAPAPAGVSCPPGSEVMCFADACNMTASDCPAATTAVSCNTLYCANGTLPDGTPVPPCTAVYTQPDGSLSTCQKSGGKGSCFCTKQYDPVCGSDGKDYGNACMAACSGAEVAYRGRCGDRVATCSGADSVMCFADPCRLASCPPDPTARCLSNYCTNATYRGVPLRPCEAVFVDAEGELVNCTGSSDNGDEDERISFGCPATDTVMCFADPCRVSSCPAYPNATCHANYCSKGHYAGRDLAPCEALYLDEAGLPVNCGGGSSGGGSGSVSLDECPANATVECFADPCRVTSCPARPDATCLRNYCINATYRGRTLGPCAALYVDSYGEPVNCTRDGGKYEVAEITQCAPGAPVAFCTAPDACAGSVCGGAPNASCLIKSCYASYRGADLTPCEPVWYDNTTGALLQCARPSCGQCPAVYAPVCGTDRKTYPNRCAAECSGATVLHPGKCARCSGEQCAIGKKNDLCILGAEGQCWAKKYECVPLPGGSSRDSLGRCEYKATKGHHHRRLLQ